MKKIFTALLLSVFLISCTNSSPDDLVDDTSLPATVTYDVNIQPIMNSQCVNCHNSNFASGNLNLENYTLVRASTENGNLIDRITRNVGDPLIMPQNGQLPQTSINLIIQWETDGFLEN